MPFSLLEVLQQYHAKYGNDSHTMQAEQEQETSYSFNNHVKIIIHFHSYYNNKEDKNHGSTFF